ncbi:MAG: T9SS type A sorting domain-containing protein [Chitinophagaceae bacterium]|nr:T9SS type A sorting domain-containing protein [Chitinophagaceae bacterium]
MSNPALQQVIAEGITEFSRVQVVDGTGRLLRDIVNNGQYQVTIKLGGLLNGFYFIRLFSEKETKTIKLAISN